MTPCKYCYLVMTLSIRWCTYIC